LEVAKINIEKHWLQNKVKLLKSDLLEIFLNKNFILDTKKIVITANLPYIKNWDFLNVDKEVLQNEPHIALFGWEKTWFELYEKFISQIFKLKEIYKNEIISFIEIWFDQYGYSKNYLNNLWLKFEYYKDLNWIYRCIKIKF
jgi:methylase of polypeptide subunit release factors